jgi:hypothetical protein
MRAGPSRDRDNNRKYESGYQKRKKAVNRKESEILKQGDLLKFLKPANIEEGTSLCNESKHSKILSEDIASSNPTPSSLLHDDPGKWPSNISDNMRILLINNRPVQVTDVDFPVDEHGRTFYKAFYSRLLPNGERVCRNWLIYSKLKTEYIAMTLTCFLISRLRPHYQRKVYVIGNTWVHI